MRSAHSLLRNTALGLAVASAAAFMAVVVVRSATGGPPGNGAERTAAAGTTPSKAEIAARYITDPPDGLVVPYDVPGGQYSPEREAAAVASQRMVVDAGTDEDPFVERSRWRNAPPIRVVYLAGQVIQDELLVIMYQRDWQACAGLARPVPSTGPRSMFPGSRPEPP